MTKKRVLALALAATMVCSSAPAISAYAAEDTDVATTVEAEMSDEEAAAALLAAMDYDGPSKSGLIPDDYKAEVVKNVCVPGLVNPTSLPSSYDSRKTGKITSVKNQGQYGTCWSFAAMGAMEASYLSKKSKTTDLSEYQFAYFFYNCVGDSFSNISGDKNIAVGDNYLNRGGNSIFSIYSLAAWRGPVDESKAPYSKAAPYSTLSSSLAYNSDKLHMQNGYVVSNQDAANVKSLIMEYGGLATTICSEAMSYSNYFNRTYNALYQNVTTGTDHAIMVVGWDDNFSSSKFGSVKPSSNGAWLIKNSWGPGSSNYDFIWVSYQDKAILASNSFAFVAEDASNYDYNYQYDGAAGTYGVTLANNTKVANIFTVKGASTEKLSAVGVGMWSNNTKYSVQIYKNPSSSNPESGTKMLSTPQTGTLKYAGFHTIKLKSPVTLKKGDRFSVVITLSSASSSTTNIGIEYTYQNGDWIRFVSDNKMGQSFIQNGGRWVDLSSSDGANIRIKAYTKKGSSTTVNVPKTSIKSLKAGSKSFTVKWAKKSVKGYQIQYSTSSTFKGAKSVNISKASTTSKKVTKLKKGKKYYVRIRTYKVVNGKKKYSAWSAKKSVKVK